MLNSQQLLIPNNDETLVFVAPPKIGLKLTRDRMCRLLIDAATSYSNCRYVWISGRRKPSAKGASFAANLKAEREPEARRGHLEQSSFFRPLVENNSVHFALKIETEEEPKAAN